MSLTHTMHPPGISASIATILTSYGPLFVLVPSERKGGEIDERRRRREREGGGMRDRDR